MQKKFRLIIFIASCLVVASCIKRNKNVDPVKLFRENTSWLIGTWMNSNYSETTVEIWERENDTLLLGKSYLVKKRDTLLTESIRLVLCGRDVYYIPTVSGQNDGKPVTFKLRSAFKNELVFENPEHDFPQKIVYRQTSLQTLEAEVSGIINGQQQMKSYSMTRSLVFFK